MIFVDKLQEKEEIIRPEFDRLLEIAWEKQAHSGDLLLFCENGFYLNNMLKGHSPYVVGSGIEGFSEMTHYSFIDKYRQNIFEEKYLQYKKWLENSAEKEERNKRIETEGTSIQIEMLIYLKFWEADMIIKRFYQFARILNGESYDWHFKVSESNRDKTSIGTRQDIIRKKIRDKIKPHSETIYNTIKNTYNTQLRNAIAHSNYSFLGRSIHLNNFIKGDKYSNKHAVDFDEWIDIFHNTLIIHNEYLRMKYLINDHYIRMANQQNNEIEIVVTDKGARKHQRHLQYIPNNNRWVYKQD